MDEDGTHEHWQRQQQHQGKCYGMGDAGLCMARIRQWRGLCRFRTRPAVSHGEPMGKRKRAV